MTRQQRDDGIISTLNGGLNVNSTPLSMELNDAPVYLNVNPLVSGGVEKRPGTRIQYRDRYGRFGVSGATLTTPKRHSFLVTKEGTSIVVYYHVGNGLVPVVTKNNVFTSQALRTRAYIISYSDIYTRAVFFTGVNAPVQLTAIENNNVTIASSSLTFTSASAFSGASSSGAVLLEDGVLLSGYSIAYDSGTNSVTITGLTFDTGKSYQLLMFTWQWWAEAYQWFGNSFYQTAPRFNTNASTDVNVAIPEALRSDIQVNGTDTNYPIVIAPSATHGTYFTQTTTPTTDDAYQFSDGTPYVSGATINPTPFFVTFGALDGTTPQSVHIFRRRELQFRGGQGQEAQYVKVYVNDASVPSNLTTTASATYGTVNLFSSSQTLLTSGASVAKFVSFEGASQRGVPSVSLVSVVNAQPQWVGSAATDDRWFETFNGDGTFVAKPGIGIYADYLNGRFPTFGTVHKERLILGGLAHQPLILVFSALGDSRTPGEYFAFFQTTTDYVLSTDAFDMLMSGKGDERGVGVVTWQDSLFFLTTRSSYRISGGNQPLSPQSKVFSSMEQVGALNPFCIATTASGVFFLSRDGLYSLIPENTVNGNYQVGAASLKVQSLFDVLKRDETYWGTAWLSYDETEKRLFAGIAEQNLPRDYSYRLFVYHLQSSAWSEYYTYGYFRIYHAVQYRDKLMALTSTQNTAANDPATYIIISFDDRTHYIDWMDNFTGDVVYAFAPYGGVSYTTTTRQEYATRGSVAVQMNGFDLLPFLDVEDATVIYDGNVLTFKTDWIKLANGNVYLTFVPTVGKSLLILPKGVL